MRITRTVDTTEAGVITVRELLVSEVRAFYYGDGLQKMDRDFVDAELIGEGLTLSILAHMSDLTVAKFDQLSQSELDEIAKTARELNAPFFRLTSRLFALVKLGDGLSQISNLPNTNELSQASSG